MGSYKNPHSHQQVGLDDANQAIEVLILASPLLRIVDREAFRVQSKICQSTIRPPP